MPERLKDECKRFPRNANPGICYADCHPPLLTLSRHGDAPLLGEPHCITDEVFDHDLQLAWVCIQKRQSVLQAITSKAAEVVKGKVADA